MHACEGMHVYMCMLWVRWHAGIHARLGACACVGVCVHVCEC